jgi:hypothetical protein
MSVFRRISEFVNERLNIDNEDVFEIESPTGDPYKLKYETLINDLREKITNDWLTKPTFSIDEVNEEITVDGTGRAIIEGTVTSPTSATLPYTTVATPGVSRIDSIVYNLGSSAYEIIQGTTAASPLVPGSEFQSNYLFVAYIEVSSTTVNAFTIPGEHAQNTDTKLAEGTADEVSAAALRSLLDNPPTGTGSARRVLSNNFEIGTDSSDNDELFYFGSSDITIQTGIVTSGFRNRIYNFGSGQITINDTINAAAGNIIVAGNTRGKSAFITFESSAWYGYGDFTTGLTGAAAFISARVDDANSNRVIAKFSNEVNGQLPQHFLIFGTHAKIDAGTAITGATVSDGYELTIALDDHVLPDDILELYYFKPVGLMRDATNGNFVDSFQESITNNVLNYNGSKTYTTVASGGSVSGAVAANTIVALQRGGSYTETSVGASDGVVFSAYGTGAKPVLDMSTGFTFNSIENVRFANLDVSSDDHGIRAAGPCHFMFVNSCDFTYTGAGNNDSGIITYTGTGASNVIAEGQMVINSTVSNYANGISSKLNYQGVLTWDNRVIGGSGTPYRYEKNVIDCQTIAGMPEGDGIAMARGRYQNSVIRNNEIKGWGDDGIDLYGAHLVTIEYNWLHNENANIENGGRGIKTGGEGGGGGEDDRSGSNTIRYNVISKIQLNQVGGGTSNVANAIDTNGGDGISDHADLFAKTAIYGNLVYGVDLACLKLDGANGANFEVYNNAFLSGTGINQFNSTNLSSLNVRNCIIADTNAAYNSNNNIYVGNPGAVTKGANDQTNVALNTIYDSTTYRSAGIRASSPTINNGTAIAGYNRDRLGNEIVSTVDIGATERQ